MPHRSAKCQIIDNERHQKRMQDFEADTMDREAPAAPCTLQRIQNASAAHRGFIKWLGLAELAEAGLATTEIKLGGFPVDRMGTEHSRALRLLIWETCIWNLDYFQSMAARYVILNDAEKTRAGHVRNALDLMKNA